MLGLMILAWGALIGFGIGQGVAPPAPAKTRWTDQELKFVKACAIDQIHRQRGITADEAIRYCNDLIIRIDQENLEVKP